MDTRVRVTKRRVTTIEDKYLIRAKLEYNRPPLRFSDKERIYLLSLIDQNIKLANRRRKY